MRLSFALAAFLLPASLLPWDACDGNNPSVNCKSDHVKTPTMFSQKNRQRNGALVWHGSRAEHPGLGTFNYLTEWERSRGRRWWRCRLVKVILDKHANVWDETVIPVRWNLKMNLKVVAVGGWLVSKTFLVKGLVFCVSGLTVNAPEM